MTQTLLDNILKNKNEPRAFALLHRPHITGSDKLEVMVGDICQPHSLAAIPLQGSTLVLIPYRQLSERDFACIEDDATLMAMTITDHQIISIANAFKMLPDLLIELTEGGFDTSDDDYVAVVQKIIQEAIGHGEGSNFVIKRLFTADITDYTMQSALTLFRRLIQGETGAYWTFLIHTGDRTLVGASPELHVSLKNGVAMMNPISGTYRYPASGPTMSGVMQFLATEKETDELYMVVEEELKMIASFCPQGGKVTGPFLKEMSRLAHTEYFIQGNTFCDPREILHDTMFAPTVTGSPLENACRVIAKYESQGRGYYSGIAALLGRDGLGNFTLDSTILIRTADINHKGNVRIGIGATIVRHSDPTAEAAETWAKVRALLDAMQHNRGEMPCLKTNP